MLLVSLHCTQRVIQRKKKIISSLVSICWIHYQIHFDMVKTQKHLAIILVVDLVLFVLLLNPVSTCLKASYTLSGYTSMALKISKENRSFSLFYQLMNRSVYNCSNSTEAQHQQLVQLQLFPMRPSSSQENHPQCRWGVN